MKISVGFVSLGCAKNLVDSEVMLALVKNGGFEIENDPAAADVIVVNTCGFIDSAKEESIAALLEMADYKKTGKCRLLVAAGCLAQRYGKDFKAELPEVDAVIGSASFDKIVAVLRRSLGGEYVAEIDDINRDICYPAPRLLATPSYTAYLKIAEGCDNNCTYCAIPQIRGRQRSRKIEELVGEARLLADGGVRELIVIAQDTTRYGEDLYRQKMLPELLRRLCEIEALKWIRVHYCYPESMDDGLIEVFARQDKLLNYFDIPVQHASDRILRLMGRKTSRAKIEALIAGIRRKIPSATLRTSIITGFPTETDAEFDELCAFAKQAKFDRMGVFAYSCEEGTAAARLKGQIGEDIKRARREKLMLIARDITRARNGALLGKKIEVMTEGFDGEQNLYFGRSGGESPDVDPKIYFGAMRDLKGGDMVTVTLKAAEDYDLYGEEAEKENLP